MRERLIPLDAAAEWGEALEGVRHGFAHTWGSCHAVSLTSGYDTFLYEASGDGVRVLCPLDEKDVGERRDVATPYGFSGFVGTGPWREFPGVWTRFAQRRGYVTAYVGLNPLFGDPSYARPSALSQSSEVYVLDLSSGIDSLWRDLSRNRKRQLRAWRSDIHETDHPRLKAFFVETYPRFMESKDAAAHYRFTSDTLEAICDLPNVFLLGTASPEGLEAVSVFGYTPHVVEALFHASVPGGEQHTVPLLWSAVHRSIDLGLPLINLGGGLRSGDSIAASKERFGALRLERRALKEVYDLPTYEKLCRDRGRDPDERDRFFPPYRRS